MKKLAQMLKNNQTYFWSCWHSKKKKASSAVIRQEITTFIYMIYEIYLTHEKPLHGPVAAPSIFILGSTAPTNRSFDPHETGCVMIFLR